MADKPFRTLPNGTLQMKGARRYRIPKITDLNPPEAIAACRLMSLMRYMAELPALDPFYDALLNELVRQGLGKRKIRGGFNLCFRELVASLKHKEKLE